MAPAAVGEGVAAPSARSVKINRYVEKKLVKVNDMCMLHNAFSRDGDMFDGSRSCIKLGVTYLHILYISKFFFSNSN